MAMNASPFATRMTEMVIGTLIIGFITATVTANTVAARLEERIAALAQRSAACEAALLRHEQGDVENAKELSHVHATQLDVIKRLDGMDEKQDALCQRVKQCR